MGPDVIGLRTPRGRAVLVATVLGSGAIGIDASVVSVALPAIGRDLGVPFAALQWTVVAYTLTLASFILLGGALGDRFGRRRVFVVGLVWFGLASALCGLAPTGWALIAARALQGVGGALATPAALAILEAVFPEEDRGAAVGVWAGWSGVTTAVAPFLGGWLLQVASWRWVFLINAPLVIVVVALALLRIPETRAPGARGGVDAAGAALGAVGLGGVTSAAITAADGTPVAPVGAVIGLAGLAAFVVVERRAAAPMLPLGIFRSRRFSATNLETLLLYAAIGGFLLLLPVTLQVVLGWSPVAAGSALLPITVITLLLAGRSGRLAARIGARLQMTVGPLVCAAAVLLAVRVAPGAGVAEIGPVVVLLGLGLACFVAPLTATALGSAPPEHAGVASGVNNAVARTGSLLAVAVLPVAGGLTGAEGTTGPAVLHAFHVACWACAALLVLGAGVAAVGLRSTGGVLPVADRVRSSGPARRRS